jgi:hypothetical protein
MDGVADALAADMGFKHRTLGSLRFSAPPWPHIDLVAHDHPASQIHGARRESRPECQVSSIARCNQAVTTACGGASGAASPDNQHFQNFKVQIAVAFVPQESDYATAALRLLQLAIERAKAMGNVGLGKGPCLFRLGSGQELSFSKEKPEPAF